MTSALTGPPEEKQKQNNDEYDDAVGQSRAQKTADCEPVVARPITAAPRAIHRAERRS